MVTDAVIFDIDGTLWNASSASASGWSLGLAQLGIRGRVTAEQIAMVAGRPYEKCVEALLPGMRVRHPGLLEVLSDCERASVERDGGTFYNGAFEAVSRLAREFDVFLVSNCQDWYLESFLGFSGLGPLLSGVDCHGRSGLPKSAMLSQMKRAHSLAAPVYVGDTAGDEAAARMAGITHIHVSWGFGQPEGNPMIVNSFAELLALLERQEGDGGSSRAPVRPTGSSELATATDYIGSLVEIRVDRPLGSLHPDFGFEYAINYGFVPATSSPDSEELDAYVLGVSEPVERFVGRCVAVIHRLNDDGDKLVIVPDGLQLSDADIRQMTHFQEQHFTSTIPRA
jgi:phosphoglycolate phosphatase